MRSGKFKMPQQGVFSKIIDSIHCSFAFASIILVTFSTATDKAQIRRKPQPLTSWGQSD